MMDIKHELATLNLVLKVAFTEIDFKALRLDVRLLTMDLFAFNDMLFPAHAEC